MSTGSRGQQQLATAAQQLPLRLLTRRFALASKGDGYTDGRGPG